ncbi:GtrA family protein [Aureimonas sp. AU12]|uniref:GtrA family protein n=1 Tax=Aureimonas sp. AU12 TaxID=1638161 RepID=UPI000780A16D|nr:GtrA family protein [Aureimonas sp. AU12]
MTQLIRYGFVGVLNTAITAAVILALTFLGFDLLLANALGFAAGLLNSFLLNRRLTFRAGASSTRTKLSFLVGFALCYALNLSIVMALDGVLHPAATQLAGMIVYNLSFFAWMKFRVFKVETHAN